MKSLLFSVALLAATAASAEPTPAAGTPDGSANPNQTICRVVNELGSRLNRSRICMTRAEWDQQRRDTRQNIERSQTWRGAGSAGQ